MTASNDSLSGITLLPCHTCNSPAERFGRLHEFVGCSNTACWMRECRTIPENWNTRQHLAEQTQGVTQLANEFMERFKLENVRLNPELGDDRQYGFLKRLATIAIASLGDAPTRKDGVGSSVSEPIMARSAAAISSPANDTISTHPREYDEYVPTHAELQQRETSDTDKDEWEAGEWQPTMLQLRNLYHRHHKMKADPLAEDTLEMWVFSWARKQLAKRLPEPVSSKPDAAGALSKAILEAHAKWKSEYQGVGHE
jgi:hypothetical protein